MQLSPPKSLIIEENLAAMCEIASTTPPGCFVELGVYEGGSAYRLMEVAKAQGRELYLYDTFTGIPFQGEGDRHKVGEFAADLETVRAAVPDAIFVPGTFPYSLIDMPPIAFVHVDADQYQSIKDACHIFPALMVVGGLMLFDDYGQLKGATRAVEECFPDKFELVHGKALVRIG
jgi:O-methyltransferase